jgi:hypothetical protein
MVHALLLSCVLGAPSNHLLVRPSWQKYSIVQVGLRVTSPIVIAEPKVYTKPTTTIEVPMTVNVLAPPVMVPIPASEPAPADCGCEGGQCSPQPSAMQSASGCANGQCPIQGGGRVRRRFR